MTTQEGTHLRFVIPPGPWSEAMGDGSVRIPGVTWESNTDIADAPGRFVATADGGVDVGENGVRRCALDRIAGGPAVGIPVFFGREHMQLNLIVREDSPLTKPSELAGKRIASRLPVFSGTGIGVLLMLEKAYGVALDEVRWQMGDPARLTDNRMGLHMTLGPETDAENFELLKRGDADAVVVTTGPRYYSMFGGDKKDDAIAAVGGLRPLITDPEIIADAYRRTGLCPITDTAVVGADLARKRPELAVELVTAFSEANALAPKYRDPDEEALAQREVELLGEDPHVYGLGDNQRRNLDAVLDLFYRMGAIDRPVEPDELFVSTTV